MNIVTPAEGEQERVQGMLSHLCAEVEKHEPEALMFCASWCAAAGVFYVVEIEGRFANEAAQEHHRNQPYTAELRRISQEEHNLAQKVEVQMLDRFAGFNRGY
ncbi:geranylgeranyl pyrophosphate synthetase [Apiospora saccharicola]